MRSKVYAVALMLLALSVLPITAEAGYPVAGEKPTRVVQQRHLEAKPFLRIWESKPLPSHLPVLVELHRKGAEVRQRWINRCASNYVAPGLMVRLRVLHCESDTHRSIYQFRFKAATRSVFQVRIAAES